MNHRIRAWGIRKPDGTLAGCALWGGNPNMRACNGIEIFPTRRHARDFLKNLRFRVAAIEEIERYYKRKFTVVPVKGTFEW